MYFKYKRKSKIERKKLEEDIYHTEKKHKKVRAVVLTSEETELHPKKVTPKR